MSAEPADPESAAALADTNAFRRVAGRFTTGISVVATKDAGIDYAMTVSAFTSVSLEPLLVLICVEKVTRFHRAVSNSGLWAVSMLSDDAEDVARWFAEKAALPLGSWLTTRTTPAPPPVCRSSIARWRSSSAAPKPSTRAETTTSCSVKCSECP